MKRFLFILLLCFIICNNVFAQYERESGDVYYTDVKAYIKDIPIEVFDIEGEIVVECENLESYGFFVAWDSNERVLRLAENVYETEELKNKSNTLINEDKHNTENIAKKYYCSDIVTYLNGKKIKSYNVDGKTLIPIKGMADCGYIVKWDEQKKEFKVNFDKVTIETDIGKCNISDYSSMTEPLRYAVTYNGTIEFDDNTLDIEILYLCGYYTSYILLKATLEALNIPFEWDFETSTLNINFDESNITQINISDPIDSKNLYYDIKEIEMNIVCNSKQFKILSEVSSTVHADMQNLNMERFELPIYEYKNIIYIPLATIKDILNIEL